MKVIVEMSEEEAREVVQQLAVLEESVRELHVLIGKLERQVSRIVYDDKKDN